MLIDWFTVAAQAINFLILAWLLRRFLYGPIIEAMTERQERLAGEMARAREMRKEADRRARELSEEREALEHESEAILGRTREEAEHRREQWMAEARAEVEARSQAWMEAVERERAGLSDRLRARMAEQVVRLSEKVLRDLAGETLEAQALDGFLERLVAIETAPVVHGVVEVRSGFPLRGGVLKRLESRIGEIFPQSSGLDVVQDDSLGFGIVMVAGDAKWEWSLAAYLNDVEAAVFAELVQAKAET